MSEISGAIKCRKPLFRCVLCCEKIEEGQIYTRFSGSITGNHEYKVHRACAFKQIGMADPLLKEVA